MRYFEPTMLDALFRGASGLSWIGHVQATYHSRESIPAIAGKEKYLIDFSLPCRSIEDPNCQPIKFKCKDGGVFLPELDCRLISLWTNLEDREEGAVEICSNLSEGKEYFPKELELLLAKAIDVYNSTHPHVRQYFFEADAIFGQFVMGKVLPLANGFSKLKTASALDELAMPFFGFEISSKDKGV